MPRKNENVRNRRYRREFVSKLLTPVNVEQLVLDTRFDRLVNTIVRENAFGGSDFNPDNYRTAV